MVEKDKAHPCRRQSEKKKERERKGEANKAQRIHERMIKKILIEEIPCENCRYSMRIRSERKDIVKEIKETPLEKGKW